MVFFGLVDSAFCIRWLLFAYPLAVPETASSCSRYLKLKKLGVGHLLQTPDTDLRQLAKEVKLEYLLIISCPALTDATVRQILNDCRRLGCLVIGGCHLVTSNIFRAYLESGSQARLELLSCGNVHSWEMPKELRIARKVAMK